MKKSYVVIQEAPGSYAIYGARRMMRAFWKNYPTREMAELVCMKMNAYKQKLKSLPRNREKSGRGALFAKTRKEPSLSKREYWRRFDEQKKRGF